MYVQQHHIKEYNNVGLIKKKNESIMIGDDIKIVIVNIIGNKISLGIEAPVDIPVHRKEVYDAIREK